jgi:hypothetical protein
LAYAAADPRARAYRTLADHLVARVAKVGRMWQRTSHLDVAKRLVGWEGALPRTTDDRFTEFVQRIVDTVGVELGSGCDTEDHVLIWGTV